MKRYLAVAVFAVLGLSVAAFADDADDCEKAVGDTGITACTRVIQSDRRQGASLAWAYNNRGRVRSLQGDLDGAIADYNHAIKLDPNFQLAYFNRGQTRYYSGEFTLSLADFTRSQKLKPSDHNSALWLYLVRARSGHDGRQELRNNTATLKYDTWPGRVVALYIGRAKPADVLKGAEHANPNTYKDQLCEAHFYLGEWHALKGDRTEATASLRAARDLCPKDFAEYAGAVHGLKRLGEQSAAPAQDTPLCTFVKRVLADRQNEFSSFKGEQKKEYELVGRTTFYGTVSPPGAYDCMLHPRQKPASRDLAAHYSCVYPELPVEEAKLLYERHVVALGACLPAAAHNTKHSRDPEFGVTTWTWEARTRDFLVTVTNSNLAYVMRSELEGDQGQSEKFKLTVVIENLSPP